MNSFVEKYPFASCCCLFLLHFHAKHNFRKWGSQFEANQVTQLIFNSNVIRTLKSCRIPFGGIEEVTGAEN